MIKLSNLPLAIVLMLCSAGIYAQEDFSGIELNDMNGFKPQAGNWFLVEDVSMNPFVSTHHEEAATESSDKRKKKKKNKKEEVLPQAVTYTQGTGVLLNMNDGTKKDALISNLEHGDIHLELDVMLPKGSNSGIYLQGRYEFQLFDSYGVETPLFSDMGGIYRNWESTPGKIYMGKAPLLNAAKAPGLWQHIEIDFRAPRFDSMGKKTENARIISAKLNGVTIHSNVEIPLPTGGPLENNEVGRGPLMIQGDHGPVAIRNIKYRLLDEPGVAIEDFNYKTYQGSFNSAAEVEAATPVAEGNVSKLTFEVANSKNDFGISYKGMIRIDTKDNYHFTVNCNGSASLKVNGIVLSNDDYNVAAGSMELDKGTYPIEIVYYKTAGWMAPKLGLEIATDHTAAKSFHSFNSFPPNADYVSPIYLDPAGQPRLLRAFMDYEGDREQRLTHTVAVGESDKMNYAYNLGAGNLAAVWKGNFVDATPMWHQRGDGSFKPRGMVQFLSKSPSVAVLENMNTSFDDASKGFRSKGYIIDTKNGRPVFKYELNGAIISDRIYPDENDKGFVREVMVENPSPNTFVKVAEGMDAEKIADGLYAMDGKSFYVKFSSGVQPEIRKMYGRTELLLPLSSSVKYSLIW